MTERHRTFVHALCVCVRAFSLDQAMRHLGFNDTSNFGKFVRPLIERDLVRTCRAFAKPVPDMREALLRWEMPHVQTARDGPDRAAGPPDFAGVLRRARHRWAGLPATSVCCYVATRRAGNLFGVRRTGGLRRPLQCTHDLCVSELYLAVGADECDMGPWRGEDATTFRLGDHIPDAVLVNARDEVERVIEVVGADYEESKLLGIHNACNAKEIPYELW